MAAVGLQGRKIDLLGTEIGGQEDAEDGAVAVGVDGGAELNFAAVALDDGACDPEAEAGAALAFGGEEGLAETALHLDWDAGAVVADRDADAEDAGIGPVARAAEAETQATVEGRRLDGIRDEVGEHLTHFARIDEGFERAIVLALDAKIFLHDAAAVEGEHFFEELVDVGADGAGGFAGEVEGLAADLRDALQLTLREGEVVDNDGGQVLFFTEQIEQVGDRLERVVDLVRDGGGEAADGDELLIFAEHDGGAIEFLLGVGLKDAGLPHFEGAGNGRGESLHLAGLKNLGGALAQNADGFAFGDASTGENDRDGRLSGAGALDDLADFDVGKAFGAGDEEVGRAAAEIVEEFAARLGEFNAERQTGVARGGAYSMVRQCGTPQHQHTRNGGPGHVRRTMYDCGQLRHQPILRTSYRKRLSFQRCHTSLPVFQLPLLT